MTSKTDNLYLAIRHETDRYTYSCEILLGVYSSKSLADQVVLVDHEQSYKQPYNKRDLDTYEVREITIDTRLE